jgi:hypothetical protein
MPIGQILCQLFRYNSKKGGEAKKKFNSKGANATFLLLLQHAFRFQRQKAARSKVSDTN